VAEKQPTLFALSREEIMNTIKNILAISALAMGTFMPMGSFAQTMMDHGKMDMSQASASMTDGEIKKVDQATGKVTIKHGEIKHMDMPGMTMVFTAKDKSLLGKVKPGDKVKFMVINEGGKMVVTDIQPAQ
jgi:Cu(I)/Ag(I) efflux system protein CusF